MHEQDPAPETQEEVLNDYRRRRSQQDKEREKLAGRQRRLLMLLGVVAVLVALQTASSLHGLHAAWPMLLSFAAGIFLVVLLVGLQGPAERVRRLLVFYDRCLARVDGSEPDSGLTGEDARDAGHHIYERDLDITGPHSLFARLATMRTGIGERGLAGYLLTPATHEESVLRQQAVRELTPLLSLREEISLLGSSSAQKLTAEFLDKWLEETPPHFSPLLPWLLGITSLANITLLLSGLFHVIPWSELKLNLLASIAVQTGAALLIRKRVLPLLEGGAALRSQVRMLSDGLAILQSSSFASAKLLALQRVSREPAGAVRILKQLDPQLQVLEQRNKELFFLLSLLISAGSQAAMAIARWKHRHAASMRGWIDAWAEFETLNALATFAFEHPEYAWPELLPSSNAPTFEARALGHPLLANSVANNLTLGPADRFYVISGSNMAGKSTLMRSIGTAAVLAYAGAPVRAASLRLTPLTLGASIALVDSLAEGKSKFLAEVERLGAIVTASRTLPVLFLVDEIFSGTNSADRSTAAAAVLNHLLANGAIGALSTHDLALTSLATPESHGVNVHMASPDPADPLAFDYILNPGINQHSNALAVIRLIGLDDGENG